MRMLSALLLVLPVFAACAVTPTPAKQAEDADRPRPNIILFLVDDMGWQDTSVQFGPERTFWNDHYRTPNMQRLADRGVKFTHAYAASPVCSPTRCAILTGQHPARTGITDWVGHGRSENSELRSPEWTEQGLQPGDGNITLPQVLRDAGYLTAHVGKAHFGGINTPGEDPTNLGFDINIGGSHAGSPRGQGEQGAYFAPFPERLHPNMQHHPEGTYITDALTQDAIGVIDRATDEGKPFFLHLAHYAVHTPIAGQGDPRFLDNYPDTLPGVERHYAAMVESMDASLGAVIAHLDANGLAENTFIIFTSDNGGLSNHTRAVTDDPEDPWALDWHNDPIYSGKGSAYEGGVRVPILMAWAGDNDYYDGRTGPLPLVKPGLTITQSVISMDVLPTVLSVAGIENPLPEDIRDGMDLTQLFEGEVFMPMRYEVFWHYPHQWYNGPNATKEAGIRPFSAVLLRDGLAALKLIYFYTADGGKFELYDFTVELSEQTNLADLPDWLGTVEDVAEVLLQELERTDAALPIDKATGETVDISNLLEAAGR